MAKAGRAIADRKKIEALTTDKTVVVSDCGTIFTCNSDTVGAFTVTLPTAADAGKGWWCKIFRIDDSANDVTIGVNGDQWFGVEVSQTCVEIDATADIVLAGSNAGLQAEMISDGTNWLVLAHGVGASSIT